MEVRATKRRGKGGFRPVTIKTRSPMRLSEHLRHSGICNLTRNVGTESRAGATKSVASLGPGLPRGARSSRGISRPAQRARLPAGQTVPAGRSVSVEHLDNPTGTVVDTYVPECNTQATSPREPRRLAGGSLTCQSEATQHNVRTSRGRVHSGLAGASAKRRLSCS